ncbi:hypothetical protein PTTG_29187 [Puccinia triticina 1-1 BBBD Race 1]|uniref:Peptidase A2 domain-containing protein n=1 Tax=Puccinia triticina (isolate 1-1 / race 1 (BBBD)) TaxID=630390 RepID=A0A180G5R3_PUCT1|nr:hypothetical protein PTTG_29187 [Puccinia triticina 1-1 BBBD Race 1]
MTQPIFPNLDPNKPSAPDLSAIDLRPGRARPPARVIVTLRLDSTLVRVLIDTESEINLVSTAALPSANLTSLPLPTPTRVQLALETHLHKPLLLTHYVTCTLSDKHSDAARIRSEPSDVHVTTITLDPENYPCQEAENKLLQEYADLFPVNIPNVTEEENGPFVDSSFPEKLQDTNSKVNQKIILTNPTAVVNEKQYPYPRKHLTAGRTLLYQHIDAGSIRRSTSQYASPSLIIPKKDPTSLMK